MSTPQETIQEFAARVRRRYPGAYDDTPDHDLTDRILEKHPEYRSNVRLPEEPARVTSAWGSKRSYGGHTGADFGFRPGEEIAPPLPGRVVFAGRKGGYGNRVEVDHGNGLVTSYSHLNDFQVNVGDELEDGQLIGRVGSTGHSTGPHLHFEVLRDGRKVNPANSIYRPLRAGRRSGLIGIEAPVPSNVNPQSKEAPPVSATTQTPQPGASSPIPPVVPAPRIPEPRLTPPTGLEAKAQLEELKAAQPLPPPRPTRRRASVTSTVEGADAPPEPPKVVRIPSPKSNSVEDYFRATMRAVAEAEGLHGDRADEFAEQMVEERKSRGQPFYKHSDGSPMTTAEVEEKAQKGVRSAAVSGETAARVKKFKAESPAGSPALERPGYSETLEGLIEKHGPASDPRRLLSYVEWLDKASRLGDLSDPKFRAQVVAGKIGVEDPRAAAQRRRVEQANREAAIARRRLRRERGALPSGPPSSVRLLSADPNQSADREYGAWKMREGAGEARTQGPSRFFSEHAGESDGRFRDPAERGERLSQLGAAVAVAEERRLRELRELEKLQRRTAKEAVADFGAESRRSIDELMSRETGVAVDEESRRERAEVRKEVESNLRRTAEAGGKAAQEYASAMSALPEMREREIERLTDEEMARRLEARRQYVRAESLLTPEDRKEIQERAKAGAGTSYLTRSVANPFFNAVATGGEDALAGLTSVAEDIVRETGLADSTTASDYFARRAHVVRRAVEEADKISPMTKAQKALAYGSEVLGSVAVMTAAAELGGPKAAFGGLGFLEAKGRGESYGAATVEGVKGLAYERVFRATAGMPIAQRGATMFAASVGIEKATGASDEDAIKAGATNALFAVLPGLKEAGLRWLKSKGKESYVLVRTSPEGSVRVEEVRTSPPEGTIETVEVEPGVYEAVVQSPKLLKGRVETSEPKTEATEPPTAPISPEVVSHPNPEIDGKPIVARTGDGRVVVPNESNKSGVSVVKPREQTNAGDTSNYQPARVGEEGTYAEPILREGGQADRAYNRGVDEAGLESRGGREPGLRPRSEPPADATSEGAEAEGLTPQPEPLPPPKPPTRYQQTGIRQSRLDTRVHSATEALRRMGGLRFDPAYKGELSYLGRKEAGTTGLVSRNAEMTIERAADHLRDLGYPVSTDPNEFLSQIADDLTGARKIYSSEREIDYDAEYEKGKTDDDRKAEVAFERMMADERLSLAFSKLVYNGVEDLTDEEISTLRQAADREGVRKSFDASFGLEGVGEKDVPQTPRLTPQSYSGREDDSVDEPIPFAASRRGAGETRALPELTKQTDSPAFKRWFEGSKVVDEKGEPLKVYHGTDKDFTEFKDGVAFFSDDPEYANAILDAKADLNRLADHPQVLPTYLSLRNPLIIEMKAREFSSPAAERPIIERAKREGYDGIIFKDVENEDPLTFYAAFKPEQIKSVNNRGTFDDSPNILHSSRRRPDERQGGFALDELLPPPNVTRSRPLREYDAEYERLQKRLGPDLAVRVRGLQEEDQPQAVRSIGKLVESRAPVIEQMGDEGRSRASDLLLATSKLRELKRTRTPVRDFLNQPNLFAERELTPRQEAMLAGLEKNHRKTVDEYLPEPKEEESQGALFSAAWHGSPHVFDKFSTEKIGTGEGAQSYGYGLYFTDKREIAEHYRRSLAKQVDVYFNGRKLDADDLMKPYRKDGRKTDAEDLRDRAIVEVMQYAGYDNPFVEAKFQAQHRLGVIRGNEYHAEEEAFLRRLLPEINKLKPADFKFQRHGALYKVDLAPEEDEYLLYDQPLSRQSPKVKTILKQEADNLKESVDFLKRKIAEGGADAGWLEAQKGYVQGKLDALRADVTDSDTTGGDFYKNLPMPAHAASDYLRSLGIRGIKYLDNTSRIDPEISRSSDGKSWGVLYNSGAATRSVREFTTKKEAQAFRDELAAKQTYNYVIFDDADVTIQEVYSLTGEQAEQADAFALLNDLDYSRDAAGRVRVNPSTAEFMSRLAEQMELERHGGDMSKVQAAQRFTGQTLYAVRVAKTVEMLKKVARAVPEHKDKLKGLASALDDSKVRNDVALVYTEERSVPHEEAHRMAAVVSGFKPMLDRVDTGEAMRLDAYVKARQVLVSEFNYPDHAGLLAEETFTHLWEGRREEFDVSEDEALDYLEWYFSSFEKQNGRIPAEEFDRLIRTREEFLPDVAESTFGRRSAPLRSKQRGQGEDAGSSARDRGRAATYTPTGTETASGVQGTAGNLSARRREEGLTPRALTDLLREGPPLRDTPEEIQSMREALGYGTKGAEPQLIDLTDEGVDARKGERGAINFGELYHFAVDLANAPRSLMSSGDLSAPLRQGAIFTVTEPRIAARATRNMLKSFVSTKAYNDVGSYLATHPDSLLAEGSGLYLSILEQAKVQAKQQQVASLKAAGQPIPKNLMNVREEQFMSRLAGKLPWVKYSEQAYLAYLDTLRLEAFSKYAAELLAQGKSPTQDAEEFKAIARFVNIATGRGELGKLDAVAPELATVLFSPRFLASRFQLLNPMTVANMPPAARRIAARKMFEAIGMLGLTLFLMKLAGAEVSLDPDDPDFAKARFGDTRIDFGAGFQQVFRFGYRFVKSALDKDSRQDPVDLTKRFVESKLAPIPKLAVEWRKDKDAKGEKFTWAGAAKERLLPMIADDMQAVLQGKATTAQKASIPLQFFGVGTQTYKEKAKGLLRPMRPPRPPKPPKPRMTR